MPESTTEHPHKVAGEALRAMREGAGMSLRAMAWRVGCSHGHLARVEYGERALTRDMGHRVSRAIADRILEKRAA
jgi:transcriptional regulator with XRE-family HTH domain